MKKYGIILSDNGSNWYISGVPDANWDNNDLHRLNMLPGSAFEAVDSSWMMVDTNSGQAVLPNFRYVFLALIRR